MNSNTILIVLLCVLTFSFAYNQIIDWFNSSWIGKQVPAIVSDVYEEEKYRTSQEYQKENSRFSLVTSVVSFVAFFFIISEGILGDANNYVATLTDNTILQALIFFGAAFIINDLITLPFQYYGTFVIEEKYGFNKMTIKTFIIDKLKGYLLTAVLGGGLVALLLYLVTEIGESFWLLFWGVISVFILLINMFYTSLIVPLFNKLTPLEDGDLRSAIEAYAKKIDFPLTNIYVIDGSKRSTKANAYFSGIGPNKKIVLFDTLIKNHTIEELVGVLAHEVGHFKKKHIISGFILSIIQVGLTFFVLSKFIFNDNLSLALGADKISFHLNLIAFSMLYSPISELMGVFMNMFSRKNEYEADAYAGETYDPVHLQTALKKLSADNLSNLTPHPAHVFMHYSHPPLVKRLEALKKL